MRCLLVILDGLGDRPADILNGTTPLQAALTPNLDALAASGINALMYPISPGIAPSSDIAHFTIFGYSSNEYPGRGYIETLGEGIPIDDLDVAFRTSFISVKEEDGSFIITGRSMRGHVDTGYELAKSIPDDVLYGIETKFVYTGLRQGLLLLKGDVSADVTDADPLEAGLPIAEVQPTADASDREKAANTARVVNEFMLRTYVRIKDEDMNFLATKWAGQKKDIDPFYEKTSLHGAIVAEGPLYKGLATYTGMDFVEVKDEDKPWSDLARRLDTALDLLAEGRDFVHVHTKVPDHAGHRKDPLLKKSQIEELDKAFARLIRPVKDDKDLLVVVTADHATTSQGDLIHSGEPVPMVMTGPTTGKDTVDKFDEFSARLGSLGCVYGRDVMPLILNYTDRIRYLGSRVFPGNITARPTLDRIKPLRPTHDGRVKSEDNL